MISVSVCLQRRATDQLGPLESARPMRSYTTSRDIINEHLFTNLRHARELISAWRDDYNHHRPHTSLDGLTPWEYHQRSVEDQTLNRANS